MTITTQESPLIGEVLRDRRKETGASKRSIYRRLGVSSQTYDAWEGDVYVPSDDYAETLADYLEIELPEVVWMLYRSRIHAKGVYLSSDSRVDLAVVRSIQSHPAYLAKISA